MNDTTPRRTGRAGSPELAEIAALTARLRDLTRPGREVDPAERAAFLADKQALLIRVSDADRDQPQALGGGEAGRGPNDVPACVYPTPPGRHAAACLPVPDTEQDRREQLNRWHTADAAEVAATDDAGAVLDAGHGTEVS